MGVLYYEYNLDRVKHGRVLFIFRRRIVAQMTIVKISKMVQFFYKNVAMCPRFFLLFLFILSVIIIIIIL